MSEVYTVAQLQSMLTPIFRKNRVRKATLFGSYSKGKATGYHYTRVSDSKGEVISGTQSEKDEHGVFTGDVKVSGVKKNGFSSFYPEEWSPQQVVDAINEAYTDALSDPDNPHGSLWIGHSGDLEIALIPEQFRIDILKEGN